jgi:hypothetical protein
MDHSTENTASLLLHVFAYAETRLLNCSLAMGARVTSPIMTPPLLLRAGIT